MSCAHRTLLSLNPWLAHTATNHLFTVVLHRPEQRTTTSCETNLWLYTVSAFTIRMITNLGTHKKKKNGCNIVLGWPQAEKLSDHQIMRKGGQFSGKLIYNEWLNYKIINYVIFREYYIKLILILECLSHVQTKAHYTQYL